MAAGELEAVLLEQRSVRAEAPQLLPLGDEPGDLFSQLVEPVFDSRTAHLLKGRAETCRSHVESVRKLVLRAAELSTDALWKRRALWRPRARAGWSALRGRL